jgi:hypothetical protein
MGSIRFTLADSIIGSHAVYLVSSGKVIDHVWLFVRADSLFEISLPCDSISEIPDSYYPGNTGLGFWYGDPNQKHNMTMMILKRPDGDLKVWPSCVWPERHASYKVLSTEFAGKQYDPAQ